MRAVVGNEAGQVTKEAVCCFGDSIFGAEKLHSLNYMIHSFLC